MTRMCFASPYLQGTQGGQTRVGVEILRYRKWESRVQEAAGSGSLSPLTIRLSNTLDPKWVFKLVTDRDYSSPFVCSQHVGDQALSSALERPSIDHYALRASCCCFCFHRSEASIVIKEFYSAHKQKPQNFQHHKNGRQEIAACNAQWAIPGL